MRRVHDRKLLDALERLGGQPMEVSVWRLSWKSRNALQGGSSGRWHPPDTFEALYTSFTEDGAIAEIYYHLSQAPVRSSAEKTIHKFSVKTKNTLRLDSSDVLAELGLGPRPLALIDSTRSQEVGAAAHLLEYDSLLVPSARWPGNNLVIFSELFDQDSIGVVESAPMNWPAWREKNSRQWEDFASQLRRERLSK